VTISAVIVDDERLARSRVARLLESHVDIEVIGECRNGTEAVEFINTRKPELIFLDVQMPDMDGFAVLDRADIKYNPFVIFATAYDQYALRAFDVHAIDYLLKPFDQDRFDESLAHARKQLRLQETSELEGKLLDLIRDYHGDAEGVDGAIHVREREKTVTIQPHDIVRVQSDGNYVTIFTEDHEYLHRITMNSFESDLDPKRFLRIHRSAIVNVAFVRKARYLGNNNEYEFTMRDGTKISSGRTYKDSIARFLSGTRLLG
jgi:two-component system LytT family response regulator